VKGATGEGLIIWGTPAPARHHRHTCQPRLIHPCHGAGCGERVWWRKHPVSVFGQHTTISAAISRRHGAKHGANRASTDPGRECIKSARVRQDRPGHIRECRSCWTICYSSHVWRGVRPPQGSRSSMTHPSYSALVIQSIQGVRRPDQTHATSTS
jgi:hypothetical protein